MKVLVTGEDRDTEITETHLETGVAITRWENGLTLVSIVMVKDIGRFQVGVDKPCPVSLATR